VGGIGRWVAVLVVGFAAVVAAGCGIDKTGVPHDGSTKRDVYPAILSGDSPDVVRRKWGEPTRILTFKDERTGADEEVWQYEPRVQADGSVAATKVTFREGEVRKIELGEINRRPPDLLRPDSAGRRDGL